jgi:hypothetical protein
MISYLHMRENRVMMMMSNCVKKRENPSSSTRLFILLVRSTLLNRLDMYVLYYMMMIMHDWHPHQMGKMNFFHAQCK